jgi:hypothetical protein
VLVQIVNIDANEKQLLQTFPNDVLLLWMANEAEVMRLEQSIACGICLHLTAPVDSLQVTARDVQGQDGAPDVLDADGHHRDQKGDAQIVGTLIYHALHVLNPQDVKVDFVHCKLLLESPNVPVDKLLVLRRIEDKVAAKGGLLAGAILIRACLDAELLYRLKLIILSNHGIEFLLVLDSLKLLVHLQIFIKESALLIHVLQNSSVDDFRLLIEDLLIFLLEAIDVAAVINIVEPFADTVHFFGEVLRVNVLIEPLVHLGLL